MINIMKSTHILFGQGPQMKANSGIYTVMFINMQKKKSFMPTFFFLGHFGSPQI